jgi:hypothetical protein
MSTEFIQALKARRKRSAAEAGDRTQLKVSFKRPNPPLLRNEPRNKGVTTKVIYETIAKLAREPLPALENKIPKPKKEKP